MESSVSNPLAWTFFADKDISIAELAVDNAELSGEVVFHCQQAVEKYMKAFLAKNKTPFKKTHDLTELHIKIKEIKDWCIDETKLERLNDLYIETRYPSNIGFFPDHSLPTKEDAQTYLAFAKSVASIVKEEIEKA
jgi:HEPN domain-containing protein